MPNAYGVPGGGDVHDPTGELTGTPQREVPPEPDADPEFKLSAIWDQVDPIIQKAIVDAYNADRADLEKYKREKGLASSKRREFSMVKTCWL